MSIRKRPFVILFDSLELTLFNMSGPYCAICDLMILHKDKLETLLILAFEQHNPDLIGNDYLVIGTTDAVIWRAYKGRATL